MTVGPVPTDMGRKRTALVVLAVVGWTGTLVSHLIARRAGNGKQSWEEHRNRFLLLSSLATNALVLSTLYRYGKNVAETPPAR